MTETLKPCPFCGRMVEIIRHPDKGGLYDIRHREPTDPRNEIRCILDGFRGMYLYESKEEAIGSWNRRFHSEDDILALMNGWLDCERFQYDLAQDEQDALDVALSIVHRRQREKE